MDESVTFSQEFLDQLPLGAYRTTPEGRIDYANLALAEMLGYPSAEQLKEGNSRHFYVDLEDRKKWKNEIESAVSGRLVCFKTRWKRLDGRIIRVENSGRAVRDQGVVVAYEGIVADISEQPAPLEQIQINPPGLGRGEIWSDTIMQQLPICILRKNRQRQIIWANDAFCQLEGINREVLLKDTTTDSKLYGAELDELYRVSDDRVMATGQPHITTERHRSSDGHIRTVQAIKVPRFEADGKTVAGLDVFFWDAANPFQPMAELEQARQRADRFESLLRSQYSAVYEHDLAGNFRSVNEAIVKLTGRPERNWDGMNISELVAPEYVDFAKARIQSAIHSPNPAEEVTSYDIEILAADKHRIPVEITSRLLIEHGKPVGVIGYIRDLSRRREVEHRRLREIHHRVKNNLQTIYTMLASEFRRTENQQTREVLEACQARVLVMSKLHQQLYREPRLDLIDVGQYIQDLTESLVETYRRSWQRITARVTVSKNVHLSLDALTPCALVLHELISNAMKHAFPSKEDAKGGGERHGTILVSLEARDDGTYCLQVMDTGVGLPSDFDSHKTRSLGLRLVHGLIKKQLKGEVKFDSTSSGTSVSASFTDPTPVTTEIAPE